MGPFSKLLDVSCLGLGAAHDEQPKRLIIQELMVRWGTDSKEKPEAEVANDPPTQPEETLETSEVEVGPLLLWMDFEGTSPKVAIFWMGFTQNWVQVRKFKSIEATPEG